MPSRVEDGKNINHIREAEKEGKHYIIKDYSDSILNPDQEKSSAFPL